MFDYIYSKNNQRRNCFGMRGIFARIPTLRESSVNDKRQTDHCEKARHLLHLRRCNRRTSCCCRWLDGVVSWQSGCL
jgi:hypothetical protein